MSTTVATRTTKSDKVVGETDLITFRRSAHSRHGRVCPPAIPGRHEIDYNTWGKKITKAESLRRCEAENPSFSPSTTNTYLDGAWSGIRPAFSITSCAPNCETELDEEAGEVWILATPRSAAPRGVDLQLRLELSEYRDHPCRCGAPNCVGYIVCGGILRSRGAGNFSLSGSPATGSSVKQKRAHRSRHSGRGGPRTNGFRRGRRIFVRGFPEFRPARSTARNALPGGIRRGRIRRPTEEFLVTLHDLRKQMQTGADRADGGNFG